MMHPTVDPRLPLHAQLATGTGNQQRCDGAWVLPADRERADSAFRSRRTTVRTAIQSLVRRGMIEIRRGKGTYVTGPKITQELTHLTGFVEDMRAIGHEPTAKVLNRALIAATAAVAGYLGLSKEDEVIRIQRLRIANGVPLSFDETYLPRALGEQIIANDLETQPIFALLEQKYGTPRRPTGGQGLNGRGR